MKKIIRLYIVGMITLIYASESVHSAEMETFWVWIALFALGIIGIAILFLSSTQMLKTQKLHREMIEKQLNMEQNQNLLITNMSEDIRNVAKQALEKNNHIMTNNHELLGNKKNLVNVENRLLSVTNDLIDFLRLKSKKIQIDNEEFNLNNVLNEVSGSVCSHFIGKNIELIFDINTNVPRLLVGDSLHLGQILNSILEHTMQQLSTEELKLEISMYNTFENKIELQFQFSDTGKGMSVEQLEGLFCPYYDEESSSYQGLGLFVAYELVSMMNGELSAQSVVGKGSIFTLTLPFNVVDKSDKRFYHLPEKVLSAKKVFIVDSNYNSALAIKKMFSYFKHEVKVLSKEEFIKNMPNLAPYDIVILNEGLFNHRLVEYLNKVKTGKELKVIALNALLKANENSFVDDVIDIYLFKPLNQERILEMIVGMYDVNVSFLIEDEKRSGVQQVKTYKSHIVETKNIIQRSFNDFRGKSILIVEDNIINQKVLINLLKPSGMKITIANNGQEAVDLVKKGDIEFDLILMDINMPVMDGYAATQMIRLDHRFDGIPIIAFTALVLDSERQKMFNSGINAFLPKPLKIGKLYTAFAMYILESNIIQDQNKGESNKTEIIFKGLDVKKGIGYANSSKALYLEVLKEFNAAYGQSAQVFKKLVNEHRYEQIKMLCIDMRGLTGTIGAQDMQILISEIHQCIIYNKQELLQSFIEKYENKMHILSDSIDQYIKS